jgi:hypothetical protein
MSTYRQSFAPLKRARPSRSTQEKARFTATQAKWLTRPASAAALHRFTGAHVHIVSAPAPRRTSTAAPKLSFYQPAGIGVAESFDHTYSTERCSIYKPTQRDWEELRARTASRSYRRPEGRKDGELTVGEVLVEDREPMLRQMPPRSAPTTKSDGMMAVSTLLKHGNKEPDPCVAHDKQPQIKQQYPGQPHVVHPHYVQAHRAISHPFQRFHTMHASAFGAARVLQAPARTSKYVYYASEVPGRPRPTVPHQLGRSIMLPHP